MASALSTLGLTDAFRYFHPNVREFTRVPRGPNVAHSQASRRLDRSMVSITSLQGTAPRTYGAYHLPPSHPDLAPRLWDGTQYTTKPSDHGAVVTKVAFSDKPLPPPRWTFNLKHLLDSATLEAMRAIILRRIASRGTSTACECMEGIRKEVRAHLTNLDAQRAAQDRRSESILRDQINDLTYRLGEGLSPPPGGRPTGPLASILRAAQSGAQANLDRLLDRRAADWLRQHGIEAQNEDRPTKEFHQRLERSEPERNIPVEEIKDNHTGNTTSDQGEINTLATEHFRQRFNQPYDDSTPQVRAARDRLLRNVKRLPAAARSKLESDQIITTEHIQQTINSLPLHKTPGEDGFPSDWYRAFAKELSPLTPPSCDICIWSASSRSK